MEHAISYPAAFAPVDRDEMVYLDGGAVTDGASILGTVATVVGIGVLATSYIWGIRQASDWLDDNAEGNLFTILGKATDDLTADMSQSISYFTRDLVATVAVVALWPISVPLLIFT